VLGIRSRPDPKFSPNPTIFTGMPETLQKYRNFSVYNKKTITRTVPVDLKALLF
jgi:hypothetical protein